MFHSVCDDVSFLLCLVDNSNLVSWETCRILQDFLCLRTGSSSSSRRNSVWTPRCFSSVAHRQGYRVTSLHKGKWLGKNPVYEQLRIFSENFSKFVRIIAPIESLRLSKTSCGLRGFFVWVQWVFIWKRPTCDVDERLQLSRACFSPMKIPVGEDGCVFQLGGFQVCLAIG